MLINDEIEGLIKKFSSDKGTLANIKIAGEIQDKIEVHFEKIKAKFTASELSAYNFSMSAIQEIGPEKLERNGMLALLIRHIRSLNSTFRAVHTRVR